MSVSDSFAHVLSGFVRTEHFVRVLPIMCLMSTLKHPGEGLLMISAGPRFHSQSLDWQYNIKVGHWKTYTTYK